MALDPSTLATLCGLLLALVVLLAVAWIRLRIAWSQTQQEITDRASRRYEEWRGRDLDLARSELARLAGEDARLALEAWKQEHELAIRHDAVARSQAVVLGKVTEHLAPYLPEFPFNPRDARFLGSPIDFVVFDGADDGEVREVVFIEVKTSSAALSAKQRMIRDAILEGRVGWLEFRV